jgi:hypothetical protein
MRATPYIGCGVGRLRKKTQEVKKSRKKSRKKADKKSRKSREKKRQYGNQPNDLCFLKQLLYP